MHVLEKNTAVYFCISTFKYLKQHLRNNCFSPLTTKGFTWLSKIDRTIKLGKITFRVAGLEF